MDKRKFYIDGAWTDPDSHQTRNVISPATEEPIAEITLASSTDLDRAAKAARKAFKHYSMTDVRQRLDLLQALRSIYKRRQVEMAEAG